MAGDLVFWGQSNGKFNAVNAKTGETLWSFSCQDYQGPGQTNIQSSCNADGNMEGQHAIGGANGAPAVYTVNGREYVVMAFGGNTQVRSGQVSPTGDALIAFALPSQIHVTEAGLAPLGQSNRLSRVTVSNLNRAMVNRRATVRLSPSRTMPIARRPSRFLSAPR